MDLAQKLQLHPLASEAAMLLPDDAFALYAVVYSIALGIRCSLGFINLYYREYARARAHASHDAAAADLVYEYMY